MSRHTAFLEAREYDNETLRSILKEIKRISNLDATALAKQSPILKKLMNLEKTDYNYWSDQFGNVRLMVELVVLERFVNDKL